MTSIGLKTGETLVIRHASKEDAQAIIDYVNIVGGESDNLTFGAGEFGMTVEQEESFLEKVNAQNNATYLIAEIDGKVVGTLSYSGGPRSRTAHTGEFGVSVLKVHWGKGIARALIEALIGWSRSTGVVRKLNLRVRSDNMVAISLYKNLGFIEHGVISREFQIDGIFYDSILMGIEID